MELKIVIILLLCLFVNLNEQCANVDSRCQQFSSYCNNNRFSVIMITQCPVTCNICIVDNLKGSEAVQNVPTNQCVGSSCSNSYVCVFTPC
uniref:ShKT domain-containing protein n=1 Tax=Strongyloides stercoralis TaxID=6248 RepID=A0A0K0DYB8_STRER